MDDCRKDLELLRGYTLNNSPRAIDELVRRHAAFVYSAARRMVPNRHLAEDVAQAVFLILMEKAKAIRDDAHLIGWLHTTTRHVAANTMKMENRRRFYEEKVAMESANFAPADALLDDHWNELTPVIDCAIACLGENDRRTLLLKYFSGKNLREVAVALEISEEAAKKRLSRGLERLRKILAARGLVITSALLAATMGARADQAIPASVLQTIAGHVWARAIKVNGKATNFARLWAAIATSAAAVTLVGSIAFSIFADQAMTTAAAESPATAAANKNGSDVSPFAPSWPIVLPGQICGSPMPVDLDGEGKLEIVVPYMADIPVAGRTIFPLASTEPPDYAAKLAAFHADGTPVSGWPVTIMTAEDHLSAKDEPFPNWWGSTAAVINAAKGRSAYVAISHPSGLARKSRGASIIRGDGAVTKMPGALAFPDPGTTLALADLTSDGTIAVLGGATYCTVANHAIPTWHAPPITKGFSSSVGDVNGDGHIEIFTVSGRHGAVNGSVYAYNINGKPIPGWPQKVGRQAIPAPSLGNVFGDGKMEVILPDQHGHILAWTSDGKTFGSTFAEDAGKVSQGQGNELSPAELEKEICTSIFKDQVNCRGQVALADLDGDGLAEIILIDGSRLRAWHGDGTGFGNPDGVIAQLDPGSVTGVSVCGPDETGGFDFFAGNYWVHRDSDGIVGVRQMIASSTATTQPSVIVTVCQDTVVDLFGDGKAEVLIATADGRVVLFQTGLKYTPQWAQWPMIGANPQHTSCWHRPAAAN